MCTAPVNGCLDTDYVDDTSMANVTINFGGGLGLSYSPKCVKVSAGTHVTFSGDFLVHPLGPMCGPSSALTATSTGTSATFTLSPAGDYGYQCLTHGPTYNMVGAIRVQ